MKMKVEIEIKDGQPDGKPLFAVDFHARTYGRYSPCYNEDDIQDSVEFAKKWIKKEGDIPIVLDKRKKVQLTNWF
jgi:hypothetical protein